MGSLPINISASRGAAVLGMSQWNTPLDIWFQIMESLEPGFCEKMGFVIPEFEENAPMRWGLAFEDSVIGLAELNQAESIINREQVHTVMDFITCHIDGQYSESGRLHEGKTTSAFGFKDKWGEPGSDHIPGIYQIQVQHQMICTGIGECVVSVLIFPKRVEEWEEMEIRPNIGSLGAPSMFVEEWASVLYEMGYFYQYFVEADRELHKLMIDEYVDFWEQHVIKKVPPQPRTYEDIKKLVKEPKGTVVASDQIWRWSQEYKGITEEISSANKRKSELKTKILDFMTASADHPIDDDSVEKIILKSPDGRKLHWFDGKRFR